MKEFDQRVKPLKEKNKKFLEKNVELTTLNRKLKDQIHSLSDENKKLVGLKWPDITSQEQILHSKPQVCTKH